jgi:hypothetical protein
MPTTTRPWPTEADFIIRDPAARTFLAQCARSRMSGASAAQDVIRDHNAAADAMEGLQEVWLRGWAGARS